MFAGVLATPLRITDQSDSTNSTGGNPFSTYAKYSEKLTFPTP